MPTAVSTTIVGLQSAMDNAVPGTVITQIGGPGDPTPLHINTSVTGDGVAVVLDPAQLTMIPPTSGAVGGFHFYGGYFAADLVNGLTASPTNYDVNLKPGANRISFRGSRFGPGAYGFVAAAPVDLSLKNCRVDGTRGDGFNVTDFNRFEVDGCAGGDFSGGVQFCYFPDGRLPQEGIKQSVCTGLGGTWVDSTHPDAVQAYPSLTGTGTYDLTLTNNNFTVNAQGFDNFVGGTPANGIKLRRLKAWGNNIATSEINGLVFLGDMFDVRYNVLTGHPAYGNTNIHFQLGGDVAAPTNNIYGGGNSAAHFVVGPNTGSVNLGSATMNGAAVDPAILPIQSATAIPSYFPAMPVTPPSLLAVTAPYPTGGGPIIYPNVGAPFPARTWFSCSRNKWGVAIGATFEYRWKLNGAIVGTAWNHQSQVGDNGMFVAECRATGANELMSAWIPTAAVAVAGGVVVTPPPPPPPPPVVVPPPPPTLVPPPSVPIPVSVISGAIGPNDLTLIDDIQGQYSLAFAATGADQHGNVTGVWTLSRLTDGRAPVEYPVINFTSPGAIGSPSSIRLTVNRP